MKLATLAAALVLIAAPQVVRAQSAAAIREFPIETVESLGRAIYRADRAAWVGTDALLAKIKNAASEGLVGYIVVDRGDGQVVRFVRDRGHGLEAAYDVLVDSTGATEVVTPRDTVVPTQEAAMVAARQTAIRALNRSTGCPGGLNTVVLKDPERDGWLVWVLTPPTKRDAWPWGIHHRLTVSADGGQVLQHDALARSCGAIEQAKLPKGAKPAMGLVTHIVSSKPVETHVFLQMQMRQPLGVVTAEGIWLVADGTVRFSQKLAK